MRPDGGQLAAAVACYLCASCLGPARVLKECGEAVREYGDEALERSRVLLVRGAEPCASSPEVMVCVCVCSSSAERLPWSRPMPMRACGAASFSLRLRLLAAPLRSRSQPPVLCMPADPYHAAMCIASSSHVQYHFHLLLHRSSTRTRTSKNWI